MSLWESEATSVVLSGSMSKKIPFIAGRISSSAVAYIVLPMPSAITEAGTVALMASLLAPLISG